MTAGNMLRGAWASLSWARVSAKLKNISKPPINKFVKYAMQIIHDADNSQVMTAGWVSTLVILYIIIYTVGF